MADDLDALLAELEEAQLLRRLAELELAYIFKHALTQETAYHSLLRKRRREIHRLVAESYEKLFPDRLDDYAALLAQHYAEAGDEARTLEYSRVAGDQADESKPAADLLDLALEKVEGDRAFVVGDAVWDVVTAQERKLPCIGLLTGGISEAELRDAGASAVYANPAELAEDLAQALATLDGR